jgi:hypothetical protein
MGRNKRMIAGHRKLLASLGRSTAFCAVTYFAGAQTIEKAIAGARIKITYDEVKTEVATAEDD